ncbi:hypothetical protein ACUOA8_52875 [Escherichia sp. SS-MK2]
MVYAPLPAALVEWLREILQRKYQHHHSTNTRRFNELLITAL